MFEWFKSDTTNLIDAIKEGRDIDAEKLINKMSASNLQKQDDNGNTPLIFSIIRGKDANAITKKLIDKMDNTAQKNDNGNTALRWAVKMDLPNNIVDTLISKQGGYNTVLRNVVADGMNDLARSLIIIKRAEEGKKVALAATDISEVENYVTRGDSDLKSKLNNLLNQADDQTLSEVYSAASKLVNKSSEAPKPQQKMTTNTKAKAANIKN